MCVRRSFVAFTCSSSSGQQWLLQVGLHGKWYSSSTYSYQVFMVVIDDDFLFTNATPSPTITTYVLYSSGVGIPVFRSVGSKVPYSTRYSYQVRSSSRRQSCFFLGGGPPSLFSNFYEVVSFLKFVNQQKNQQRRPSIFIIKKYNNNTSRLKYI